MRQPESHKLLAHTAALLELLAAAATANAGLAEFRPPAIPLLTTDPYGYSTSTIRAHSVR